MQWWMWLIIVPSTLYLIGAVRQTVHLIRTPTVSVAPWYNWIFVFLLWPLAWLAEHALDGMMM